MTERCDLTDLYAEQCAHCRRINLPELRDLVEHNDPWLQARYSGRCASCDDYLEQGDLIKRHHDGYLCHQCGRETYGKP